MKMHVPVVRRLFGAISFGVISFFLAGTAPAFGQASALSGPYVFVTTRPVDQSGNSPTGALALLNLDGAGNVTGSYYQVQPGNSSLQMGSGAVTGTYSQNSDGTVTLSLMAGNGASISYLLVTTGGGAGFYMIEADSGKHVVAGNGRAVAQASALSGNYSLVSNKVTNGPNDSPSVSIGEIGFDSAGNITGGVVYNLQPGIPIPLPSTAFTGTYTPNNDGTFSATVNVPGGGSISVLGAATDGGAGFLLIETSGNDVVVTTGQQQ